MISGGRTSTGWRQTGKLDHHPAHANCQQPELARPAPHPGRFAAPHQPAPEDRLDDQVPADDLERDPAKEEHDPQVAPPIEAARFRWRGGCDRGLGHQRLFPAMK
jgi:hypothetical protein